jgi:hypothetical protein
MESNHPSVGLPRPAGFEGLVRFPTSSTAGSGGAASRTVSGSDLHGETPASRIPGALVARDPSAMMRSPAIGIAEERYARAVRSLPRSSTGSGAIWGWRFERPGAASARRALRAWRDDPRGPPRTPGRPAWCLTRRPGRRPEIAVRLRDACIRFGPAGNSRTPAGLATRRRRSACVRLCGSQVARSSRTAPPFASAVQITRALVLAQCHPRAAASDSATSRKRIQNLPIDSIRSRR